MIVVLAIVLIDRAAVTAVCCNNDYLSSMKAKEELSEKTSNIPANHYEGVSPRLLLNSQYHTEEMLRCPVHKLMKCKAFSTYTTCSRAGTPVRPGSRNTNISYIILITLINETQTVIHFLQLNIRTHLSTAHRVLKHPRPIKRAENRLTAKQLQTFQSGIDQLNIMIGLQPGMTMDIKVTLLISASCETVFCVNIGSYVYSGPTYTRII